MSINRTFISKEYINKEEVLKTIEKIALKQDFRVEKENVYSDDNDIDIIIDPSNNEDDLVYRSSMRIKSKENFHSTMIIHNNEEYYIHIYTRETFDDNRNHKYFNGFIREFLQAYPSILVEGKDSYFVSIEEILNESERVPGWMLMY
jgi:hypothetical protein